MAVAFAAESGQVTMLSRLRRRPRTGRRLCAVLAAGLISGAGLWIASPSLTVGGPLVAAMATAELRRHRERTVGREAAAVLPHVVDQLVQQLRSGRSLAQSCAGLDRLVPGQAADRLSPLPELLRSGRSLEESARALGASADHGVRLFAVTLEVLAVNGGPAIPALQRLRHTLMAVVHGRQRTEAESSQALASAGLLVLAPGVFAVLVAAVDPGAAELYLFEPLGAACIVSALVLSWAGWWWIHQILAAAERSTG